MKDPKRIKRILKLIEKIWTKYPDLRLGQIIDNCVNVNLFLEEQKDDLFYLEDDILEDRLKEYLNNLETIK